MGIFHSCFHVPDSDNGNATSGHCYCPKCFFQRLKNKHRNIFRNTRAISLPDQQKSVQEKKEQDSKSSPQGLDGTQVDKLPSPYNEDVCPTCLEDYTQENPKIVAKCSHHYHLGCIYEWMERSLDCPACGKVMEFCESS